MASNADVIIIGAGIAGTSTAYHLAGMGVSDVLLIDRDSVAAGATGRSGAEVFVHGDRSGRARLVWESLQIYRDWPETVGGDAGFRQTGTLALMGPEHREQAESAVAASRASGVSLQFVSPEDVKIMQPFLRVDDLGGAVYSEDAGHGDGYSAANAFAAAAREQGVRTVLDTSVTEILVEDGRAVGVRTDKGDEYGASTVVLAAGAWSAPLAATAGVELDVTSYRICAGLLVRPPEIREHMSMTDRTIGTYWRMEGPDLTLFGVRNKEIMRPHDPDTIVESIDENTMRMWFRAHLAPDPGHGGRLLAHDLERAGRLHARPHSHAWPPARRRRSVHGERLQRVRVHARSGFRQVPGGAGSCTASRGRPTSRACGPAASRKANRES